MSYAAVPWGLRRSRGRYFRLIMQQLKLDRLIYLHNRSLDEFSVCVHLHPPSDRHVPGSQSLIIPMICYTDLSYFNSAAESQVMI
jgi:hypothetical protein